MATDGIATGTTSPGGNGTTIAIRMIGTGGAGIITLRHPRPKNRHGFTGRMVRGVTNPATAGKGLARAGKCHADTPFGPSHHAPGARRAYDRSGGMLLEAKGVIWSVVTGPPPLPYPPPPGGREQENHRLALPMPAQEAGGVNAYRSMQA